MCVCVCVCVLRICHDSLKKTSLKNKVGKYLRKWKFLKFSKLHMKFIFEKILKFLLLKKLKNFLKYIAKKFFFSLHLKRNAINDNRTLIIISFKKSVIVVVIIYYYENLYCTSIAIITFCNHQVEL